jgi:hypothetical protein
MPRFGSQALIVSRREHLVLEQPRESTPKLFCSLEQPQAGHLVLLLILGRVRGEPSATRPISYSKSEWMTARALFTPWCSAALWGY